MSNPLDRYSNLIRPFPERGVYDVRPEPGLARSILRDTPKQGRISGAAAVFKVLGGPYPDGAAPEKMTRDGGYIGRVIDLEFHEESRLSWRVERDIGLVLEMARGLDVQRLLSPNATLADIINAVAGRLQPTVKNSHPPRLLMTVECRAGNDGRRYFAAVAAEIAGPYSK
ncbi:hypothetical protein WOC76_11195 [Methylocystis sp. IM3]|uniref:hypothetical protein n=1 Tax=unclassified Methylocystis TaxID=2625913 RepID=UPI0030F7E9B5